MAKAIRSVVLGTAGHIDHGKTTLVRALTGTETDRLPEEKRRGITIELGFAPWRIADDLEASIVDVPGHEGFVRTMVAGAAGIDAVILVVSAEDGVMPQTREHINVCSLLGVQHSVVALTKVDRLEGDAEAIELACEDVAEALQGTVFEQARIVPCSGQTKEGLDELEKAVRALVASMPRRDAKIDPVLPLDRVFTIKGHGTVVTGTLLRGEVNLSKETNLTLVPGGERREPMEVRARGAQVRGGDAQRVVAATRLALNLGGVDTQQVQRGDVLTRGSTVRRSEIFHAWLDHVGGHSPPWKRGTTLEICIGTAHEVGRIDPLWLAPAPTPSEESDEADTSEGGGVQVKPGRRALVRIRTQAPLPVWRDARVIVRSFADLSDDHQGRTVGGGTIVDPLPSSGRKQRPRWIGLGKALSSQEPEQRLLALIHDAGALGISQAELEHRSGIGRAKEALGKLVGTPGQKGAEVLELGRDRLVHRDALLPLVQEAVTAVDRFHAQNPMQPGIGRATVEAGLSGRISAEVATLAVDQAVDRGALRVVDDHGLLARPGKGLQVGAELPEHMQRVLDLYEHGETTPPTLREVQEAAKLDERKVLEIVGVLQRRGDLIKVTPELSFAKAPHDRLLEQVRQRLREAGTIDVQALKAMTGLTRKFAVPFLEHLDTLQITLRQGDKRIPGPRA